MSERLRTISALALAVLVAAIFGILMGILWTNVAIGCFFGVFGFFFTTARFLRLFGIEVPGPT